MNMPALSEAESADLGELSGSIGFLLRMAQLQAFEALFQAFPDSELKPGGQFSVLWVIGLNPGIRQGTLARRLAIRPAHMTKVVQRMVTKGLVARTIPDDDRRSVRLSLTGKGQAMVDEHKCAFIAFHKVERGVLTEAESEQLIGLLRKLTGIIG